MNFIPLVGIVEVHKSQAARMVNNTRPIPGREDYYITELDVFHELHCLVSTYLCFAKDSPAEQ